MFAYTDNGYASTEAVFGSVASIASVCVPVLCLVGLRHHSRSATPWSSAPRALCAVLLTAALTASTWWENALGYALYPPAVFGWMLALIGAGWLVTATPHVDPNGSDAARARAVDQLIQAQTLSAARRRYLRNSRVQLAGSDVTPRAWQRRWHQLAPHDPGVGPLAQEQNLRHRALGQGGHWTPRQRAGFGALIALVSSIPWAWAFIASYGAAWLETPTNNLQMAAFILHAAHWSLYGAVFGYAYPQLRGDSPVTKAVRFLLVIAACELTNVVTSEDGWLVSGSFALATSVVTCLALGLGFEVLLIRDVGYRWTDVRSLRSAGSLLTPATTFIVAVATAIATVLATAWSTSLVAPTPAPQGTMQQPAEGTPTSLP
ncbi:hypothetical protein ACWD3I_47510 [Streptomyces sp. NPDC002817]|uniref:hypothetical protein n=1 Tax=Streptomyces sp. NPDC088357 TaxID=3154655 RepID=UPI0034466CFD